MRIKINGHEIEGSADEVAVLLNLLGTEQARGAALPPPSGSDDRSSPFMSEQMAYDVLTRRPLATSYETMLKKLDAAGDGWTSAEALQKVLGLSTREFAGLLGAFGRRISHTSGKGSRIFFDQYWDSEHGYNLYRLPPSVRAALKRAGVV